MTVAAKEDSSVTHDLVQVEGMDHFIELLVRWHTNRVDTLQHMINVPEGVVVEAEDGKGFTLEGPMYKGFQLGLKLALMELGALPFGFESEDDDPRSIN